MKDENYNISSFDNIPEGYKNGMEIYDLFAPSFYDNGNVELVEYVVPEFQAGRIDLVIESMYNDINNAFSRIDLLLHINGIDNPLNIYAGMKLLYPQSDLDLDNFKYNRDYDKTSKKSKNSALGIPNTTPNKSNRVDSKRRDYLANVSLPPTINATPQPGVRVENNSILIGGIN